MRHRKNPLGKTKYFSLWRLSLSKALVSVSPQLVLQNMLGFLKRLFIDISRAKPSERNPGITRILTGDPLAGETERLRQRVTQLFDRIEVQLRQIIREMPLRGEQKTSTDPIVAANLLLSLVEGRIGQYVRSNFERKPTTEWDAQWQVIREGLF